MRVTSVFVYPVKSCKGIKVQQCQLINAGLKWDRQWCVVKDDTGRFLSQREKSILALVEVALPAEALESNDVPSQNACMRLRAPGMEPLDVPLTPPTGQALKSMSVWEYKGLAADEGDAAASWFTQVLGVPARLVRYLSGDQARYTEEKYAVGFEVRLADGFPLLLASESSLKGLNEHLPQPLPMTRFRPNIVVDGDGTPWLEDDWRRLTIQPQGEAEAPALELVNVKPCSRCKVTTIDQDKGAVDGDGEEPLNTLRSIRSGKVLGWSEADKSTTHEVFFGWNCVARTYGTVRVGDVVSVTASGPLKDAEIAPQPPTRKRAPRANTYLLLAVVLALVLALGIWSGKLPMPNLKQEL